MPVAVSADMLCAACVMAAVRCALTRSLGSRCNLNGEAENPSKSFASLNGTDLRAIPQIGAVFDLGLGRRSGDAGLMWGEQDQACVVETRWAQPVGGSRW